MTTLPTRGAAVNAAAKRELLLNQLRLAAAKSRMLSNLVETIGVSLKHRQVDVAGAMQWLKEEGALDLLDFGPRQTDGAA